LSTLTPIARTRIDAETVSVSEELRVLVTGAQQVTPVEAEYVRKKLRQLFIREIMRRPLGDGSYRTLVIIQGRCPVGGVDRIAELWAKKQEGARNSSYPADWRKYGKAAGPIRNTQMVKEARADRCLAFPGIRSRGTWDCLEKAAKAGITTYIYPLFGKEVTNASS
jgi:hypothetical protein